MIWITFVVQLRRRKTDIWKTSGNHNFYQAQDLNILSDISGVCGSGDSCDGCISSGGIFISPLSCHTGQAHVAFKHTGVDTFY